MLALFRGTPILPHSSTRDESGVNRGQNRECENRGFESDFLPTMSLQWKSVCHRVQV